MQRCHHAWIDVHGEGQRREEQCTYGKNKKKSNEERKVREEAIFVPVPEGIRRPMYFE